MLGRQKKIIVTIQSQDGATWITLQIVSSSKDMYRRPSIENVSYKILAHYSSEDFLNGYFEVKDNREYPDNLMINILDVAAYVEASGGIEEFDYAS